MFFLCVVVLFLKKAWWGRCSQLLSRSKVFCNSVSPLQRTLTFIVGKGERRKGAFSSSLETIGKIAREALSSKQCRMKGKARLAYSEISGSALFTNYFIMENKCALNVKQSEKFQSRSLIKEWLSNMWCRSL